MTKMKARAVTAAIWLLQKGYTQPLLPLGIIRKISSCVHSYILFQKQVFKALL